MLMATDRSVRTARPVFNLRRLARNGGGCGQIVGPARINVIRNRARLEVAPRRALGAAAQAKIP